MILHVFSNDVVQYSVQLRLECVQFSSEVYIHNIMAIGSIIT